MIHMEAVIAHARVEIGMSAALVDAVAVLAHVNTRCVNGQRQVAVERLFCRKNPEIALSRFTGRSMRAICAMRAALGHDVLMTFPHGIISPDLRCSSHVWI